MPNNSNRGDVASLAADYCSLIIRVSHLDMSFEDETDSSVAEDDGEEEEEGSSPPEGGRRKGGPP